MTNDDPLSPARASADQVREYVDSMLLQLARMLADIGDTSKATKLVEAVKGGEESAMMQQDRVREGSGH